MNRKKGIIIALILAILGIGTYFYIRSTYFFSPIFFKTDSITYLPFYEYKRPMTYQYYSYKNNKVKGDIKDGEDDISFIYDELKKSKIIGPGVIIDSKKYNIPDEYIGELSIWSSIGKERGMVNNITWYGSKTNICKVTAMYKLSQQSTACDLYIEVTKPLSEFLKSKIGDV